MNHRDRLISVKVQRVLILLRYFCFLLLKLFPWISLDFLPINANARDVYEHELFLV